MILDSMKVLNEKTITHRNRVRAVYSTTEGKAELFNLIYDCGLLEEIGPERLGTRNFAVKKLQELGILDERVIREIISNWLDSRPEVKEMTELKRYSEELEER